MFEHQRRCLNQPVSSVSLAMAVIQAFLTPPGARYVSRDSSPSPLSLTAHRRERLGSSSLVRYSPTLSAHRPTPRQLPWPKVLLLTAGTALSTTFGPAARAIGSGITPPSAASSPTEQVRLYSVSEKTASRRRTKASSAAAPVANVIPLDALGIKRDEFLTDRELRRRKTTQFSEAEQEIMELEEWEVDTQWFRDMQTMWAALASVLGIFVLYKGGVMWENWIKEQERKDMEEEIELTGKFIDPRAVRKDDEGDNKKKGSAKKPPTGNKPGDDYKQGDIESLEKLFGKS